jgi:hypothetical protein|tara:strand:- start:10054 stop:10254 length:201 start_codon:yes stop_codon:yes gene_type:complete
MSYYRVDDWAIYKPFPDEDSEILKSIEKKCLILYVYPKEDFYDYKIFIDGEGKIKNVREQYLFPFK